MATFIAKFERLLYEAKGQNWPDVNRISVFRNALSPTIRNRLAQQLSLPRTYNDFIAIVQQLANRSATAPSSNSNSYTNQNSTRAPIPLHRDDPMDISNININSIALEPIHPYYDETHASYASDADRIKRRENNLCVRCGSATHLVEQCKLHPYSDRRLFQYEAWPTEDSEDSDYTEHKELVI